MKIPNRRFSSIYYSLRTWFSAVSAELTYEHAQADDVAGSARFENDSISAGLVE